MEQRKTRRFKLELPLSITRAGAERVAFSGFTKNISSCGVLFTTTHEPDLSAPIEYIITLTHDGVQPVNLRCVGKVMRAELNSNGDGSKYLIAATLERYEFVRDRSPGSR